MRSFLRILISVFLSVIRRNTFLFDPGITLSLPLHPCGAPGKSCPKSSQHDLLPLLQSACPIQLIQQDRNTCRRSISIFLKVHRKFFHRKCKPSCDRLNDPLICLMQDKIINLLRCNAFFFQQFPDTARYLADCKFKHPSIWI